MRPAAQSFLRHPFSAVFAQGSDVRVLRELVKHGGELPVSALLDRTRLTRPSVLTTLERLKDLGYVESIGGAHRVYRIDRNHPLASALSALFAAEEQRFRDILDYLRKAAADMDATAAWLYGSVSRGEDGPYSDIDVVFIDSTGNPEAMKVKLREALRGAQDALRFTASIIVLNAADIVRLAENGDPWWSTMTQNAVPLAGAGPATIAAQLSAGQKPSPGRRPAAGGMTRTGSTKKVDRAYADGRLANARAYLQAARDAFALAEPGSNANPVMSQIVNAAIAYTDALTAQRKSMVNQQDHGSAIKLLREAFGRDLPTAQERQLRRILEDKDEVQYGVSVGRYTEADKMIADIEGYAAWAEEQLIGR